VPAAQDNGVAPAHALNAAATALNTKARKIVNFRVAR